MLIDGTERCNRRGTLAVLAQTLRPQLPPPGTESFQRVCVTPEHRLAQAAGAGKRVMKCGTRCGWRLSVGNVCRTTWPHLRGARAHRGPSAARATSPPPTAPNSDRRCRRDVRASGSRCVSANLRNGLWRASVIARKWCLRYLPPPAFSIASAAASVCISVSTVPPDFGDGDKARRFQFEGCERGSEGDGIGIVEEMHARFFRGAKGDQFGERLPAEARSADAENADIGRVLAEFGGGIRRRIQIVAPFGDAQQFERVLRIGVPQINQYGFGVGERALIEACIGSTRAFQREGQRYGKGLQVCGHGGSLELFGIGLNENSSSPGLSRRPMNILFRRRLWVAGTRPAMTLFDYLA